MSSKLHVSPGALSVRDIRREADNAREQAEKHGFSAPRRWRRKSGRTEFIAMRTYPEIKKLIHEIADQQQKHLGEVMEDAVRLLHRSLQRLLKPKALQEKSTLFLQSPAGTIDAAADFPARWLAPSYRFSISYRSGPSISKQTELGVLTQSLRRSPATFRAT